MSQDVLKRERGRPRGSFTPQTPYQEWYDNASKRVGLDLKAVAEKAGIDYSALWKIVRGNPAQYPGSRKPGYLNALAIGEVMGDPEGSLRAAEYTKPSPPTSDAGRAQEVEVYAGSILKVRGSGGKPITLTEDMIERLELEAKLLQRHQERN